MIDPDSLPSSLWLSEESGLYESVTYFAVISSDTEKPTSILLLLAQRR